MAPVSLNGNNDSSTDEPGPIQGCVLPSKFNKLLPAGKERPVESGSEHRNQAREKEVQSGGEEHRKEQIQEEKGEEVTEGGRLDEKQEEKEETSNKNQAAIAAAKSEIDAKTNANGHLHIQVSTTPTVMRGPKELPSRAVDPMQLEDLKKEQNIKKGKRHPTELGGSKKKRQKKKRRTGDGDGIIVLRTGATKTNRTNDDSLLPRAPKRGKDGVTPYGRICGCMCQHPNKCRDLMWRWVRLKEGKYVNYLTVPRSNNTATPLGRHVRAHRQAVWRHLYNTSDEGETITRTVHYGKKEVTTTRALDKNSERISLVHFHPEAIPYLLENGDKKLKLDKYRIPMALGKNIGLKEGDECPMPDSHGVPSYFLLPTYSLEQATADVERAEEEYKRQTRETAAEHEKMTAGIATDPAKYISEIHDWKQRNVDLTRENKELKSSLVRERVQRDAIEKKVKQLQRDLDKMSRRDEKQGTAKKRGRLPPRPGPPCGTAGHGDAAPLAHQESHKGSGGRRWSDPRTDRAVQAMLDDPTLSLELALRIGGFDFPSITGACARHVVDADNVSVAQRKNNLSRRLRHRRDMHAKNSGVAHSTKEPEDGVDMAKKDEHLT